MKFKAAILVDTDRPLEVDYISSGPLSKGQVLVKIVKSGICGSQLFEVSGQRGPDKYLPHLLGHEATAIVCDVGPDVSTVSSGDHVVLTWIRTKGGLSADPAKYDWNGKTVNSGRVTTFSEYSVVSEDRCLRMDRLLLDSVGPAIGCALATGFGMTIIPDEDFRDKSVAVIGIGGIGMSVLLGLSVCSPLEVIAIDTNDSRLADSERLGVKQTINPLNCNAVDQISAITNGRMLDYVFDCSGSVLALESAINLINNKGLVKFATHPKHGDLLRIDPFQLILGKRIEGSWGGGVIPELHYNYIANIAHQNSDFLAMYNSRSYSLEMINSALSDMKLGSVMRPVISF
ncbi:zinc-binding dehydrogenase [bacterium]|nr:zinc-binding dehydrogenase [bacterium]